MIALLVLVLIGFAISANWTVREIRRAVNRRRFYGR